MFDRILLDSDDCQPNGPEPRAGRIALARYDKPLVGYSDRGNRRRTAAGRAVLLATRVLITCGALGMLSASAQAAASYRPGVVLIGFRPGATLEQRLAVERSVGGYSARPLGLGARPVRLGLAFVLRVRRTRV